MSRFPKKEAETAGLAERLWRGLLSNRPIYPNPPIHTLSLTLVEQPRTKELEYRIIAVNKASEGEPSNTEMVVL